VREPAVRGLDRLPVGGALDAEDLVVISLLHVLLRPFRCGAARDAAI
jgi:hypothetical protein